MSFLRWFGKREASHESVPEPSSDLAQVDITLPINRLMSLQLPADRGTDLSNRRSERLERRELLYGVVRECMTAAGVLSSTYKFKVLSLDSSGRKYLIMVDLPHDYLVNHAHFVETEGFIARSAKERYDILVTAVYWRVNELVSAAGQSAHAPSEPSVAQVSQSIDTSIQVDAKPTESHAALQLEEVMAFKRAVAAAAASGTTGVQRSETRQSGRRNKEHVPDFSNTEPFEAATPLGTSQFGGLG